MKQCHACGQLIDDAATVCPYCRAHQDRSFGNGADPTGMGQGETGNSSYGPKYAPGYNDYAGAQNDYSINGYYARNNAFDSGPEGKSRGIFALLAIFLGGLGIQYFYLGKVGGGLLTILLTFVTCGFWELITLIQGIIVLCQNNYDFQRKYVQSTSTMPLF